MSHAARIKRAIIAAAHARKQRERGQDEMADCSEHAARSALAAARRHRARLA